VEPFVGAGSLSSACCPVRVRFSRWRSCQVFCVNGSALVLFFNSSFRGLVVHASRLPTSSVLARSNPPVFSKTDPAGPELSQESPTRLPIHSTIFSSVIGDKVSSICPYSVPELVAHV